MSAKERRAREKKQRRSDILAAAREILLKKGMPAASMHSIAKAAELSVGTLYLYFKNKEELFAALQEEGLDLLHEYIAGAAESVGRPRERLDRIALMYLEFSEQHRSYFDIINYFLTSPEVSFPAPLKNRIDEHGDRILSLVEKVLLLETGKNLKKKDARRCALVLWSTLHGMLQLRKLQGTILANQNFRELYLYGAQCAIGNLLV